MTLLKQAEQGRVGWKLQNELRVEPEVARMVIVQAIAPPNVSPRK